MPSDEYGRGLDRWSEQDWLTRFLADWTPVWGVLVYRKNGADRTYPSAVYGPYTEEEARALVERPSTHLKPPGDSFHVGRRAIPWLPGRPPPPESVPMDDSDK
ncbi:hypothetical protein IU500_19285 [Nocardia terpenica]|uniref:hypothetical protein n=1 Tax=Nocardia terpenica TaxID=455432 RepID=UPI00189497B4|nr:hypothetical protein [Nocardia terpenica]MBF6062018.1 hypothetical protein [Nocardia terpenica]MBF6106182.1 hypothetical protein [Nocardia terpenica]MBF6110438.1 hypothetical protein [Nocardia terpenica]MBF6120725.1 hypothetical protein [Nocardia terpenica]MBF6151774.1 hypothetical protein [Nocardia terpenica]